MLLAVEDGQAETNDWHTCHGSIARSGCRATSLIPGEGDVWDIVVLPAEDDRMRCRLYVADARFLSPCDAISYRTDLGINVQISSKRADLSFVDRIHNQYRVGAMIDEEVRGHDLLSRARYMHAVLMGIDVYHIVD